MHITMDNERQTALLVEAMLKTSEIPSCSLSS